MIWEICGAAVRCRKRKMSDKIPTGVGEARALNSSRKEASRNSDHANVSLP